MPNAKKPAAKKAPAKPKAQKPKPAEKPSPPKAETSKPKAKRVQPVWVDNHSRRSDEDALEGHFVDVIAGEHKGLRGTFVKVETRDKDGYPESIIVQNRDHSGPVDLATVKYADVRPAESYTGGR